MPSLPSREPDEGAAPDTTPAADPVGTDARSAGDPNGPDRTGTDAQPSAGAEAVSVTGRPIDDGPVIGQLEPGGPPSTPADPTTGQHAAARPYPPVIGAQGRAARTPDADGGSTTSGAASAEGAAATGAGAPSTGGGAADSGAAAGGTPTTHTGTNAPAVTGAAGTSGAAAAASAGTAAADASASGHSRTRRRGADPAPADHHDLPERPSRPGVGRHLLGTLLGLVLTPVALLLSGIGTARLSDAAVSGDPVGDALGITLLALGVVLLAVIVLLGTWSPAVPLVGGAVWGVGLGLAYLIVPVRMEEWVDELLGDRVLPAVLEQLTDNALSGHLLVTGTLLTAAGIAIGRARRIGRRWAERVALADAARAEAVRADAARAEQRAAAADGTA
ncbi:MULTISPECIES: hypothetical protein [unclassified Actinotalea]|uniref:hypothetical protein n=1 Tax=unclassified Actinotalea TaxID=2638618 RepID=UPI0015F5A56E|nr:MULTISPECIES: hypothetical protein [unclassified Actinotalea]